MENDKNENKKNEPSNLNGEQPQSDSTAFFWVGAAASAAGLVLFVLTLCIPHILGVYGLIAEVLCSLASLSFLNTQKKKNNFKAVLYVTIAAYVLLAVFIAFFIGGIIYASLAAKG